MHSIPLTARVFLLIGIVQVTIVLEFAQLMARYILKLLINEAMNLTDLASMSLPKIIAKITAGLS